jgi:proteasome lid subunit RPN8/RPN11
MVNEKKIIDEKTLKEIRKQIQEIVESNLYGKEYELCGVVVETEKGIEVREIKNNSSGSKSVHYEMCPLDFGEKTKDTDFYLAEGKNKLIGIWHTHPNHTSHPSTIDLNYSLFDKNYIIYSPKDRTISVFKKQILN